MSRRRASQSGTTFRDEEIEESYGGAACPQGRCIQNRTGGRAGFDARVRLGREPQSDAWAGCDRSRSNEPYIRAPAALPIGNGTAQSTEFASLPAPPLRPNEDIGPDFVFA